MGCAPPPPDQLRPRHMCATSRYSGPSTRQTPERGPSTHRSTDYVPLLSTVVWGPKLMSFRCRPIRVFFLFLTEGYQGRLLNKAWTFQKSSCIDLTWGVFAALYLVAIYDLEPEWLDNIRTSSQLFYICLTALWKKVSVDHATMTSKIHCNCSKKIK